MGGRLKSVTWPAQGGGTAGSGLCCDSRTVRSERRNGGTSVRVAAVRDRDTGSSISVWSTSGKRGLHDDQPSATTRRGPVIALGRRATGGRRSYGELIMPTLAYQRICAVCRCGA